MVEEQLSPRRAALRPARKGVSERVGRDGRGGAGTGRAIAVGDASVLGPNSSALNTSHPQPPGPRGSPRSGPQLGTHAHTCNHART